MIAQRLTILMPLHRSRDWLENICQNIERCPCDCRIIISDITLHDDTVTHLTKRYVEDPRIMFRQRKSDLDWRHHLNELFELVKTEFFSILPHDDYTSDDYYPKLIAALDEDQQVGVAFGLLAPTDYKFSSQKYFSSPPFALRRRPPWHEAIALDQQWNLGIPWRGVIRSTYLWPTPITPHGFSDQLWVFGIALQTYLKEVSSAVYYKRYHDKNTHSSWKPLKGKKRMRLLRQIIHTQLDDDIVSRIRALAHLRMSNVIIKSANLIKRQLRRKLL